MLKTPATRIEENLRKLPSIHCTLLVREAICRVLQLPGDSDQLPGDQVPSKEQLYTDEPCTVDTTGAYECIT